MDGPSWPVLGSVISAALFLYWYLKQKKRASVRNKVVLITGASSGLGEACAKVFYKAGAKVILSARRTEELERVKKELLRTQCQDSQGKINEPAVLTFDLTDEASVQQKIQEAVKIHGHIDLLINNGGVSYRGEISNTSLDVDRKVMEVNYFGQIALTKAILPQLVQRSCGHIVFVSSIQGKLSVPFRSAYSASKHALQAFADCLRSELHATGVKVSVVSPGYIATSLSLNAVTGDGSSYGEVTSASVMDKTTSSGMTPQYAAEQILNSVTREDGEVLLSTYPHRLAVYLRNILPNVYFKIMASRAAKQRKDL